MTEEEYERAYNLVTEKKQAEERLSALKTLKNLPEQKIKLNTVCESNYYFITLTQEDIEVLIDHEEMKVGEYDRKFREL